MQSESRAFLHLPDAWTYLLQDKRMTFPRIGAGLFVLLLIGCCAAAAIGLVARVGPALAHGNAVEHEAGKIVAIGPGKDFWLETAEGQRLRFQCNTRCRGSLGHLQRHLREHAYTDVYYIRGENNSLLAMDVD
jgi:hypothetical protein